jgi:hypothetical protein
LVEEEPLAPEEVPFSYLAAAAVAAAVLAFVAAEVAVLSFLL